MNDVTVGKDIQKIIPCARSEIYIIFYNNWNWSIISHWPRKGIFFHKFLKHNKYRNYEFSS
jgi:hypothetical protein